MFPKRLLPTSTGESQLPDGWREVSLGLVADVRFSSVDKLTYPSEEPVRLCNYIDVYNNDYITGDLEFMRASATQPEISRFGLQVGDVLITKDSETPDEIGIPAVVDYAASDLVCGYHLALIRPKKDEVDPTFLAKQLLHHRLARYFGRQANGLTRYGLPIGAVVNAPLWLPTIDEQKAIGAVLDTVDEAIAKTEAVIAKLKQVRAGLLHDLLTRGLDEHGQLRDPIAHPEQFKDSPLGRIPKEWEVVRLGGQAQFITSGSRGWARYYSDEGALFLRIGNLTRERIDLRLEDVVRVHPPLGSEGARTRVQSGDILISITADLGIIGVIPKSFEEAYVNQHIALVRPVQGVCPRWIGRYLSFGPTAMFFRMLNDTGAKAGMNLPSIESLLLAIPTHEEQDYATTVLDAMDTNITEQLRFAAKLQHLKSALMSDLLTGRVRVPADIFKENP